MRFFVYAMICSLLFVGCGVSTTSLCQGKYGVCVSLSDGKNCGSCIKIRADFFSSRVPGDVDGLFQPQDPFFTRKYKVHISL